MDDLAASRPSLHALLPGGDGNRPRPALDHDRPAGLAVPPLAEIARACSTHRAGRRSRTRTRPSRAPSTGPATGRLRHGQPLDRLPAPVPALPRELRSLRALRRPDRRAPAAIRSRRRTFDHWLMPELQRDPHSERAPARLHRRRRLLARRVASRGRRRSSARPPRRSSAASGASRSRSSPTPTSRTSRGRRREPTSTSTATPPTAAPSPAPPATCA